jgi:hypothetical protein
MSQSFCTNNMLFCRVCGKEIHAPAPTCPHCGSLQGAANPSPRRLPEDSIWMAIASLVLGIACVTALFDDSPWDKDTVVGLGILAVVGLALGAVSLSNRSGGKGMALAGVILSVVSILAYIGITLQ